jgi:hypothetical protein
VRARGRLDEPGPKRTGGLRKTRPASRQRSEPRGRLKPITAPRKKKPDMPEDRLSAQLGEAGPQAVFAAVQTIRQKRICEHGK